MFVTIVYGPWLMPCDRLEEYDTGGCVMEPVSVYAAKDVIECVH